jgi:hypothetical protein
LKTFLQKHLSDVLIVVGSGLVVFATWVLSWIAAVYVAGGILIVLGVLIGIGVGKEVQRDH